MAASSPAPAKVCVVCKNDCSAVPRVKDSQGRYCCKSCNDALAAKQAAARPVAAPAAASPFDGDGGIDLSSLADGVSVTAAPVHKVACPGCGAGMDPGSVLCTTCGYNKATGKASKVKVSKERDLAGGAAKAADTLVGANPAAWALGGVIGGAIGAAIWAMVIKHAQAESGWIAWGVGILTGGGVYLMARSRAGALSGTIAVVICLAAMALGRYFGLEMMLEDIVEKLGANVTAEEKADVLKAGFWATFDLIDIIFVFLGVATAYTAGSGGDSF